MMSPSRGRTPTFVAPAGEQVTRLDRGGRGITFARHGSGDTALVLIHGGMCDRSHWHAQVAALAGRWTVITVDLAGHGESDPELPADGLSGMAADVAAGIAAAGVKRVVLVGHSLGSLVALAAMPLLGDAAAGLVVVDFLHAGRLAPPPPPPASSDALRAAMRQGMFPPHADEAMRERVLDTMLGGDPQLMRALQVSAATFDVEAALRASAHLPLTMIFGGMRPVDPAAIRALRPDTQLFALPEAGHFVMLDAANAFNDLLATQARLMLGTVRQL